MPSLRKSMMNKEDINLTMPEKERDESATMDTFILFPEESELNDRLNLIFAARRGNVTGVEELVNRGYETGWLLFGISPLVAAMRAGHMATVKTLIEKGVQVDEPLYKGRTAVALAIVEGLESFASLLISNGAKVNVHDDFGLTPLMLATKKGNDYIVDLLLSHPDCIVDQIDITGRSALSYAAISGNVEIAKRLLDAGANPNLKDHHGKTVLMFATMAGCLPLVEQLLKFGIDINMKNDNGFTALMLCADKQKDMFSLVKRLVEAGADFSCQNKWHESVLMLACGAGQLQTVDLLTSRGADLNSQNVWGETPLMYAAERGHYEIIELLLKRGSRMNQSDERGNTALMHSVISLRSTIIEPPVQCIPTVKQICNDIYACRRTGEHAGSVEVVLLLLHTGSDARAKNVFGQTALMMAAMHGRTKLVEVIIEHSKSISMSTISIINMSCNNKFTALTYAALGGHSDVITQLLKYKTFVNRMPDEVGQAINMAVICDYPEIVSLLLNANLIKDISSWKHLDQSMTNACKRGKSDSAKFLLDYFTYLERLFKETRRKRYFLVPVRNGHPDVFKLFDKVYFKRSAILAAFQVGSIGCLELIHRATVQSNSKHLLLWKQSNHEESTVSPLTQKGEASEARKISLHNLLDAVACGDGDEVKKLLTYGTSLVNKSTATGLTALAYACIYGYTSVVAELLAKGARADKTDLAGCSPLMFAARFGHTSCVQLLLRVTNNVKQARLLFYNALVVASEFGYEEIVQLLLNAGAEIPRRQETALHVAAYKSQKKVMEILMKADADINQSNELGQTPLMNSARNGDESSVKFLLNMGAKRNCSDNKGRTALSLAAERGKMPIVKLLLHEGCSIFKADKYGALPIWHAAKTGYPDVVEELLDFDISMKHAPHSIDYELDSFHSSQKAIHTRALKYSPTIKRAVTVNNVCKTDGTTPLMHMCQYGFHHTVAHLCGNGAITDIVNSSGQTALHVAALHGRVKVCNVLLVYGADAEIRDKQGKTPLLLALSCGHLNLLPVLENANRDAHNDSHRDSFECSVDNSPSGNKWISFKSRFRLSLRRRPSPQHSDRKVQSAARHRPSQIRATGEPEGAKKTEIMNPKPENDVNGSTQQLEVDSCTLTYKLKPFTVRGYAEASKGVSSFMQAENSETIGFPQHKIWSCMAPSLLDSDFDSNPFDCESTSSALSLDKSVDGASNMESDDRTACLEREMSLQSLQCETISGDQAPLSSPWLLSEPSQSSAQSTLGQPCHLHKQDQEKLCWFSNVSHSNVIESTLLSERPDYGEEEIYATGSPLALTNTQEEDPNLDIGSMTKKTIHAAVNQCLQQLPTGIVQNITRRATSCHTSAAATIQQDTCGCGNHGLIVNLNQVLHIKSQVKKKKTFHPRNLKISRAKYLTTGKHGKIVLGSKIGSSKLATNTASDCGNGEDDEDEEDSGDGYETDNDLDTTESEED